MYLIDFSEFNGLLDSLSNEYYKLLLLIDGNETIKKNLIKNICGNSYNDANYCINSCNSYKNYELPNETNLQKYKFRYINLGLVLSKKLKEVPKAERCYYVQDYIDEIINNKEELPSNVYCDVQDSTCSSTNSIINKYRDSENEILVLDNIEIIFSKHLKIDPLKRLKNISRYRKIIAFWPGYIKDEYLIYAEPWHKDYIRYHLNELECLYINFERSV